MAEPTVQCPNCRSEIRLTESLAAPLIAATRAQFEQQLSQKDALILQREQAVREQERLLGQARRGIEQQIAERVERQLEQERAGVAAEEARKARLVSAAELEARRREVSELQAILEVREHKLAEAQQAQA